MSLYIQWATSTFTCPKLLEVGPEGYYVFSRGLVYSKIQLTDGFVPRSALPLVAFGVEEYEAVANHLVGVGLWRETEGGWTVGEDNWARHQTTREQVEEKRRAESERKAEWRKRKAGVSRDCPKDVPAGQARPPHAGHVPLSRPCPTNVPSTETETETETETSSSKRESPVKRARKGAATASPRSQADPLASFPELEAAWPTLIRLLAEAHPYVVITDDRVAAMRKELADAARIDGLPAADIAACLTWLFKSPHRDAAFWRKNVQSFAGLRKSKTPGLPGKLQRILDAWAYAQSGRERTMGEEFGSIHATSDAAPAPSRQPKDHSKGPTMAELFNEPSPESDQ